VNRPCGHQSRAATHCEKRISLIGTRILSFDHLPTPMCDNYEVISLTDTVSCSAQPAPSKTLNCKVEPGRSQHPGQQLRCSSLLVQPQSDSTPKRCTKCSLGINNYKLFNNKTKKCFLRCFLNEFSDKFFSSTGIEFHTLTP